ncbi:conserved hypothetical protein [Paraburkholderia tropica]
MFASHAAEVACSAWSLLLTHPRLRPAEQRDAQIAAHHELLAAVFRVHLAAIDLAVFRIENMAAVVFVAGLLHAVDDRHAEDQLILARVRARGAAAIGLIVRAQSLDDLAAQAAAAVVADLHECFRLAGVVVDGLPDPDGRAVLRVRGGDAAQQRAGQRELTRRACGERNGATVDPVHVSSSTDVYVCATACTRAPRWRAHAVRAGYAKAPRAFASRNSSRRGARGTRIAARAVPRAPRRPTQLSW